MPADVISVSTASRRSVETRAKLLAAARRLFSRDGYHAVRPQDVAREAGVAQGTFYQYFDDKLACFLAFCAAIDAEMGEAVMAALADATGFEDRLVRAIEAVLVYSEEHPAEVTALMADSRVLTASAEGPSLFNRWVGFWTAILETGRAEGKIRLDLDLNLAGASVLGVLQRSSAYGYLHERGRDAIIEHIRLFIVGAMAAEAHLPPEQAAQTAACHPGRSPAERGAEPGPGATSLPPGQPAGLSREPGPTFRNALSLANRLPDDR